MASVNSSRRTGGKGRLTNKADFLDTGGVRDYLRDRRVKRLIARVPSRESEVVREKE